MKQRFFRLFAAAIVFTIGATFARAQQSEISTKQIEVKIYLQKTLIDPGGATSIETAPVTRKVNVAAPLRAALEALFSPITAEEERQNYSSATFGMRLEGVELKNGTALVRFSQPPDELNYGSGGAGTFAYAIEQTAKQFRTVKRVKICAVGETLIDSESLYPFPRCSQTK